MLLAIRQHFQERHPQVRLAVDLSFGSWQERASYGLAAKLEIAKWGRSRLTLGLMPRSFRQALGVLREVEINAVLDAAGFAFGDQHPLSRTLHFAEQVERWTAQGKPVVLLPQAFGPFEKPGYAAAFARIVQAATLVFARDPQSLGHVERACGPNPKIRLAPDFTNLLKPELQALGTTASRRVCIVPNQRMLEQAVDAPAKAAYLDLLAIAVEHVRGLGCEPLALLHGEEDRPLVAELNRRVAGDLAVADIRDPMTIKQFIGESHLVIGSRFHALVSALSQGVPALATSWSHKYEALFADYGQPASVIAVSSSTEEVRDHIDALLGEGRARVVEDIRSHGAALEQKTRAMWGEVEAALGLSRSPAQGVHAC